MTLEHDPSVAASDPGRSAWVAANAGSGKTHTLANRVTRLLLAGVRPERVLCLTYTKAAAAEMQTRLFKQLGKLAMLNDEKLKMELKTICGEPPKTGDLPKARRLFAQALETRGGLKIQTIHGFCQSMLARFPLEAGIAPGFEVLDEQTASRLIAGARERVFERAGSGDPLIAGALADLVTEISEQRLSDMLKTCLGTDRRNFDRFFRSIERGEDALERAVRRCHGVEGDETEDSIVKAFCAAVETDLESLHIIVRWLEDGSKTDRTKAERLNEAIRYDDPHLAFDAFRRALLTVDGERYKSLVTNALASSNPGHLAWLERFLDQLDDHEQRRRAAHAAELCHSILLVLDAVRTEYAAAKRARAVLDYDDLIIEARRLLERSDAALWVLFKLDKGIDHILIDEAQDTSPAQWAIVGKLTEEFFAGSGSRRDTTLRTIFAVGDEKQSIFSFQGAEPEQFARFGARFEARSLAAEREFINEPLETSRRSAPEVLQFVDEVFREPGARDGLTRDGAPIKHFAHRAQAKGRVELWPSIKPPDKPEPDTSREVDLPSVASAPAQLARKIASQIREWIDRRLCVNGDRNKPVRPGDIMILLPRRDPFGPLIMRALKGQGIAVAGADRMRLIEEIAVQDLIALGRFVLQPQDDLTLAVVLRSPFCNVGEDALFELCHAREGNVWGELQRRRGERGEFAVAHDFLSAMLSRADFAPPFEFFADALSTRGARRQLLQRLGADAEETIEEFLSLAFTHEASNTPSLEGFLDWIEKGGAEIKRDMERFRDEVRVMTVHGAKGLEADIVILPDTTTVPQSPAQKGHLLFGSETILFQSAGSPPPSSVAAARQAASDAAMREQRRLFYVALTRARDRLYICGFENRNGVRPGSWYALAEAAATKLGTKVARGGESVFVIGDQAELYGKSAAPAEPAMPVPGWVSMAPAEVPRPRLLRPSDAVDDDEPAAISPRGPNGAKRFERGLLVHALLAGLPEIAPELREASGRRFLTRRIEDEAQREQILAKTLAVLADPAFAVAFAPGSRAEVALVADLPELGAGARVNGRVDRLAVSAEEVLIVDFKSNRLPPSHADEIAPIYIAQMALYRAAVAKIFSSHRVACALVWTDGPKLMALSDDMLDDQLRKIRVRLDPGGSRS